MLIKYCLLRARCTLFDTRQADFTYVHLLAGDKFRWVRCVYNRSFRDQETHIQIEQTSESRHIILEWRSCPGQDTGAPVAWAAQDTLSTVYGLTSETVSSRLRAPDPAPRRTVPPCKALRGPRGRRTLELCLTAAVKPRPAQGVLRIKAVRVTFTELEFLRSTTIYCKAYKGI